MTHGAMIAAHAAHAAAARARTAVLDAMRVQGATAPERARPLAELGLSADSAALREWMARGVIRSVDSRGRPTVLGDSYASATGFYLDETAYIAQRDRGVSRRRVHALALLALALLLLGLALLLLVART